MPRPVIMPALEMAQETGTVIRWLKAPGAAVEKGEAILEIETDKASVEIEAPASGVLDDVTAEEGDVIPVGRTIAMIYAAGEARGGAASASAVQGATPRAAGQGSSPLAAGPASALPAAASAGGDGAALPAASPKARRLAAERGIDLRSVRGSGPAGAILAGDLAAGRLSAAAPSSIWRVMAERMTASWTSAPHFYLAREVRARALADSLERARRETAAHVTYTDLLVKLVANALAAHPATNVSWQDGNVAPHVGIDIGLAVALEDGLIVPVIHGADQLTVAELAARRADLVARAQRGKLRAPEIQGGGFTISNLGMYGVDAFSAILNPPQAAILAVGRIADRVVAVDGQAVVEPGMVLTLSCDHRALDGARAARFLGALADLIESPPAWIFA